MDKRSGRSKGTDGAIKCCSLLGSERLSLDGLLVVDARSRVLYKLFQQLLAYLEAPLENTPERPVRNPSRDALGIRPHLGARILDDS